MTDIQARLADINARAAPLLAERDRLSDAIGKAVVMIIGLSMLGLFYAAGSMADQHFKIEALKNQEIGRHG
ncbi:hypothetical protein [Rhizobium mongolense]